MYAHTQSESATTYGVSYSVVGVINSLEDWGRVWRHCHPTLVGSSRYAVAIRGRRITAWSLFRDDVRPVWEDPSNVGGVTLTLRGTTRDMNAAQLWADLVMDCVRGAEADGVVGVQIVQKPSRGTMLFLRAEVWVRANADLTRVHAWLATLTPASFSSGSRTVVVPPSRRAR